MYHLPAYVALEGRLLQKLVAVVLPEGPEGPRRFAVAGASRVLVVGGSCPAEPGLEVLPGPVTLERLPLRDGSVDALTCLEGFAGLAAGPRRSLVAEARRVLRRRGVFAVCAAANDGDLWRAEDELRRHFSHVAVFARLEWQGISLAPLLEAEPGEPPPSSIREGLLRSPLPARGYLLLASLDAFDEAPECVVVPTGPAEDAPRPREIAEEIPVAAAPLPLPDIEDLFAEVTTPPPVLAPPAPQSPELLAELERLRDRVTGFERERQKFFAHTGKLAAELERSREEKARTETELHAARLRIESLQRVPEDSRMHSLASLMRAVEVPGAQPSLAAHELVDEVAPLVAPESGRATTDAALDRNRLREELARRTAELQELETRVLQQEEEIRREHLENVRLVTDVDRMREQVERSRAIEQERVQELERLGHELRKLEVVHAELKGLHNAQEQRLREREGGGGGVGPVRETQEQITAEREQLKSRERATGEIVRRRDRELGEATRTVRELRRTVEDHASIAAELRGELAVMQVHVQRLEETVPTLQERLREQQRKTLDHEEEAAALQRRLEEGVAEQEHLRGRLRRQRQDLDTLAGAKQGAEVELFRLRRELEAKHEAIEQLQQIVALGTGRFEQVSSGSMSEGARAEVLRLRTDMAEQAAEHAKALARSEAEHQRIVEGERVRLRRSRVEAAIRAEEMEFMLFQLDTAEQRIWEMNDATDRSAARLAAGLAQLEKQKEQYEDLVDELEVTRNLLVQAQAKIADLERLLDSERTRIARISVGPTPTSDPEVFDVSVDEPDPEVDDLAPIIRRHPDEPDRLAGINFDEDADQESLVVRLAGRASDTSAADLPALPDPGSSGPAFPLPSDDEVDLDDDDFAPPPARVVLVPDEDDEDEEVFAIDTDGWIEEEDDDASPAGKSAPPPRPPPPSSSARDREHSNARIVIEILEDEAWPEDEAGEDTGQGGPNGGRGAS